MEGTPPVMMPRLDADLLLLHPPAFFDFRDRSDIYFPYMSTSGDVPITPLYEYFPLGFKTLQRHLAERGHRVEIANISTLLLKYPEIDLERLLRAADVRLFGIDLHWMIHSQGSLALAKLLKRVHCDVPIVFGGISSTYFAEQLIRYPNVDFVMMGYDTHAPMDALMTTLKSGGDLGQVPNLAWKTPSGEVRNNGLTHMPNKLHSCGVDWSDMPREDGGGFMPIREFLSTQTVGCAYNCGWCGGSRDAFRRLYGRRRTVAPKAADQLEMEFDSIASTSDSADYHLYAVGSYNESASRFSSFLDQMARVDLKSVSYEQYRLTPEPVLREMVRANPRTTITLCPESHDVRVARLAGRGVYTMKEMENWIERALDLGIQQVDVWFFIGMPEQGEASVCDTVEYCHALMRRFRGKRVVPLLCPMIPLLDPASTFFTAPEAHGYRVFYRTLEEHRRALERASLINRINYETEWLSRADLVRVGYGAVRRLTEIKGEMGLLSGGIARSVIRKIDDALGFIRVVHRIDCIADRRERGRQLEMIGDDILSRNREMFFGGVANQSVPISRQVGGRWFDAIPWDVRGIQAASRYAATGTGSR